MKCGIVGLPNVGKSTLFNAITNTSNAECMNYAFCTIDPNIQQIFVKDERLSKINEISNSEKIIYNTIKIVDIAGLVEGASKGEGLGNKFLSNIKEVDTIIHVVRCFEDGEITHVNNKIDPIQDIKVILTELALSDLSTLNSRCDKLKKNKLKNTKKENMELNTIEKIIDSINTDEKVDKEKFDEEELDSVSHLNLITLKPMMYVLNTDENGLIKENNYMKLAKEYVAQNNQEYVTICAKIEQELNDVEDEEEKQSFLNEFALDESGINKIAKICYKMLNLITFFTVGPQECRAWKTLKNSTAPDAAGVIHTDFKDGFIKAETISYHDYIKNKGYNECKNKGLIRFEGKEYIMNDGDIVNFKFNKTT